MCAKDCLAYALINGCGVRKMSVGDLVQEFCKLPNHEEMAEVFAVTDGECGREAFLKTYDAPAWVWEFLETMSGHCAVAA